MAKPTIAKVFAPSTLVMGGSASTLTITLTNSNTVAITCVILTDNFPTNAGGALIQVADTPTASNNCGATFAPVA
ncbi:MAG: hypothetical protein HGA55_04665, partial [Methanoregulaceae archaeon]|nr:hypothetical protein [Methanoregulaceae archaeon]